MAAFQHGDARAAAAHEARRLTAHGFRSTFREWVAETGKPADVAEAALAHTLVDNTHAAYQRGDLLDRRREMMAAWTAYCEKALDGAVAYGGRLDLGVMLDASVRSHPSGAAFAIRPDSWSAARPRSRQGATSLVG